jgi:hypothetical protein
MTARFGRKKTRQLGSALAELRHRLQKFCQKSASENGATPKTFSTAPVETNADTETPSALELLSNRLGLSPFEQDVLFLCVAMELDTRIAGLCARAQDDPQRISPRSRSRGVVRRTVMGRISPGRHCAFGDDRDFSTWRATAHGQRVASRQRIVNYLKG